jgi:hypothetical protein
MPARAEQMRHHTTLRATLTAALAGCSLLLAGCGSSGHAPAIVTVTASPASTTTASPGAPASPLLTPDKVSACLTAGGSAPPGQQIYATQDNLDPALVRLVQSEGLGQFQGQYQSGEHIDEYFFSSHTLAEQALKNSVAQGAASLSNAAVINNDLVINQSVGSTPGASAITHLPAADQQPFDQCHQLTG